MTNKNREKLRKKSMEIEQEGGGEQKINKGREQMKIDDGHRKENKNKDWRGS